MHAVYTNQVATDPTAVMGRRIAAFLINLVIALIIGFVVSRSLVNLKRETVPADFPKGLDVCDVIKRDVSTSVCFKLNDTVYYSNNSGAGAKIIGFPILASFLNSVVLAGLTGASIGKHIVGLRVVRRDTGAPAGLGKELIRWLLWVVDGFPWCFPLVGLITGLAVKGHRRVGDLVAATMVVGKASVGVVPGAGAPMAAPGAWVPPPPGQWSPPAAPTDPWAPPPAPSDVWAAPTAPADPWSTPPAPQPTASTWPPPAEPSSVAWTPAAVPATSWNDPVAPVPAPMPSTPEQAPVAESVPPAAAEPQVSTEHTDDDPNTASAAGPQWDAARNAYVQWEPVSGQWMQFDDAAQEWRPIS